MAQGRFAKFKAHVELIAHSDFDHSAAHALPKACDCAFRQVRLA